MFGLGVSSLHGKSKMCRVDLSEVTAICEPDGEKAMENIAAGSKPRRTSRSFASCEVDQSRMSVPFSPAVAIIVSSGLSANARSGALCAGIMLTFFVFKSTICTCPFVRPGKMSFFSPRQQRPNWFGAVSYTPMRPSRPLSCDWGSNLYRITPRLNITQ